MQMEEPLLVHPLTGWVNINVLSVGSADFRETDHVNGAAAKP